MSETVIFTEPTAREQICGFVAYPDDSSVDLTKGFRVVIDDGVPELDDLRHQHRVLGAYIQVLELIEKTERETGKPLTVTIPRDVWDQEAANP
jgi:hypothetical protein